MVSVTRGTLKRSSSNTFCMFIFDDRGRVLMAIMIPSLLTSFFVCRTLAEQHSLSVVWPSLPDNDSERTHVLFTHKCAYFSVNRECKHVKYSIVLMSFFVQLVAEVWLLCISSFLWASQSRTILSPNRVGLCSRILLLVAALPRKNIGLLREFSFISHSKEL